MPTMMALALPVMFTMVLMVSLWALYRSAASEEGAGAAAPEEPSVDVRQEVLED